MNRRSFLRTVSGAASVTAAASFSPLSGIGLLPARAQSADDSFRGRIYKAMKYSMIQDKVPLVEKFRQCKRAGFDGISLMHPHADIHLDEAIRARDETGLPIHNVNQGTHWQMRLSDADPDIQQQALEDTLACIRFAHGCGADSILLVIGKVTDPEHENHDQVWERSITQIRKAIPLSAELGVRILCENVGNGFCESAEQWAQYLDEFDSPWVGSFFDIGNNHSFGGAHSWIHTLGTRIVKLDIKDHISAERKNVNLFEGDVDWAAIRSELRALGFTGWATAEVRGGDEVRLREVAERMDHALGLA